MMLGLILLAWMVCGTAQMARMGIQGEAVHRPYENGTGRA